MKPLLRHLPVGAEVEGHVPDLSEVAKWRHIAAEWTIWALRGRSEVLERIEMQMEVGSVAMRTVVFG
jgi:hypothetical protein